ncbi:MAG: zinc-binding dehydrogenase [bacterium]|nr:zinc-binding dehydrogenase [bacterium]
MSGFVSARAAIAHAPGEPLRIEEVAVREPGPGEVRVRIIACGICASDLHVWRTGEGIGFPAVLGHEAAGRIEAIGPGVLEPAVVGRAVVIAWTPRCGRCRACRAGRPHVCAGITTNAQDGSLELRGVQLGRYMNVSGLAERVVVPASSVVPVPDEVPFDLACLVGCGVSTGFGAVANTGGVRWGETVAVFGCGGVGLSAVQAARVAGASRIIAVEPNRTRLELAGRLGATDLVSPEHGDPVAAIHGLIDGGVDLAVEAVGSGSVARQAFDALAPGGRAIVAGLTGFTEEVHVPIVSLLLDKTLRGSIYGSMDPARDFQHLFSLAAQGRLRLDPMAGPDYPLDKVNDAFEALASGQAIRPRVILEQTS